MKEILPFLEKEPVQYLATIGLDGRPKVRPFQYLFETGGKLWFCTANTKEVFRELAANSFVELCVSGEGLSWVRISGRAVFSSDLAMKARAQEVSPLVKSIYQTPDHPAFEVFFIDQAVAWISALGGQPPKRVEL